MASSESVERGKRRPTRIFGAWLGPGVIMTNSIYPMSAGSKERLSGSIVGENAKIGAGAIILPGIKIGKGALIGAGALVTESKEIPDGSLVMGAPGKVVRQLDDNAIKMLGLSAQQYQINMRRFREGLQLVAD